MKSNSLVESLGDVKGVDLVGFRNHGVRGLRSAFGHAELAGNCILEVAMGSGVGAHRAGELLPGRASGMVEEAVGLQTE